MTETPSPTGWRGLPSRSILLLFLFCLVLLSSHPTAAQRNTRINKRSSSLANRTSITDPVNARGVYTPRNMRKDKQGSEREAADPGMIPWEPALSTHTAGKPWRYKTGDGVIRERGGPVEAKVGQGQVEAERRTDSNADESGEKELDAELAPKAKKAAKKDAKRARKQPAVKKEEAAATTDTDAEEPVAALSSNRLSQRIRGEAHAAANSTPKRSKPAPSEVAAAEGEADAGAEANEGDDFDFDSALERKKSAYAAKVSKASDKTTVDAVTEPVSAVESENTDAASTPAVIEQPAAAAATEEASTKTDDTVPAAEPAEPTTKSGSAAADEEELTVAGVLPPDAPEPRRSKPTSPSAPDDDLQKESEPTSQTETPAAEAAADATPAQTMEPEAEASDELAASPVADNQAPVESKAEDGAVEGETQEVPAAPDAQAASTPTEEAQPLPAAPSDLNDLPAAVTESPAAANPEQTVEAASPAVDAEAGNANVDEQSANADVVSPAVTEEKEVAPVASTDDPLVTPTTETPSIPAETPLAASPSEPIVAPSDELNSVPADTPPVDEAGGLEQAVPPVETPTRRRIDDPAADESDNAVKAAEDAAQVTQPVVDPAPTEAVTPSEPDVSPPISSVDPPPVEAPVEVPVTPSTPTTEVGATPTLTLDGPLTDISDAPVPEPASTPAEIDAAGAAAPVAEVAPLTDSNDAELPIDSMPESPTPTTTEGEAETQTDTATETDSLDAAAADGAWKRSTSTSSTSFLRRSFTAGFVLCVVIGCVVLIGKKVKETLDSHEDEGSESLLGKIETGQSGGGLLSTGVLGELAGAAGKKDEYDGRVRMKAALVDEESEEDRYQQQQNKLRASLGQVTSRGMSLNKQPHLPPHANKKPTLAVQQVDDEEDTELEEVEEEDEQEEVEGQQRGGDRTAAAGTTNGSETRREKKSSHDEWESFDNDWDD